MEKILLYTGKDIQKLTMDTWLLGKASNLRPIAIKWFNEIKNCAYDIQDIFHDGFPMGCVQQAPFAYVNAFSAHVNVGFFYGTDLPDKNGMLEGNGKRMRHIKIKPDLPLDETATRALITASYLDIKRRLQR